MIDGLTLLMVIYVALALLALALRHAGAPRYDCADCPATYADHRELVAHERSYHS